MLCIWLVLVRVHGGFWPQLTSSPMDTQFPVSASPYQMEVLRPPPRQAPDDVLSPKRWLILVVGLPPQVPQPGHWRVAPPASCALRLVQGRVPPRPPHPAHPGPAAIQVFKIYESITVEHNLKIYKIDFRIFNIIGIKFLDLPCHVTTSRKGCRPPGAMEH